MSDIKLGKLCDETVQRDAIHVACAPVVAGELLRPGQHVGLDSDGNATGSAAEKLGIVDPFLPEPVKTGERFLFLLYQNAATGMRHHWTHPAFPDTAAPDVSLVNGKSMKWLSDLATEAGFTYEKLISITKDYARNESKYSGPGCSKGHDAVWSAGEEEFWTHVTAATGISPVIEDVCCAGEVYYGNPFNEEECEDDDE